LIIGFVTHFLALFACPLKFLRLKGLTPCRVLGGLGGRLSLTSGPFPDALEDAGRVFLGNVSRFWRWGWRPRRSQRLGSEWIGTTLDPAHETAYRARSHLVSEIFFVSKVVRDLLPGLTGPPPGFDAKNRRSDRI
jgi:hypothetical protein